MRYGKLAGLPHPPSDGTLDSLGLRPGLNGPKTLLIGPGMVLPVQMSNSHRDRRVRELVLIGDDHTV
jgi:hypothetical protein